LSTINGVQDWESAPGIVWNGSSVTCNGENARVPESIKAIPWTLSLHSNLLWTKETHGSTWYS
jgi:hypothetical protein